MSTPMELTKLKRRRGVVRGSITRVDTRLKELEDLEGPSTSEHAKQLAVKLETLDSDFKSYHFQIIDLLDSEEQLGEEQEALDKHDDHIAEMNHRLNRLCSSATPTSTSVLELLDRKLNHLIGRVASTKAMIDTLEMDEEDNLDPSLLEQTEIQLLDYKTLLAAIHSELLLVENQESISDMLEQHGETETTLFQCSHKTRRLLKTCPSLSSITSSLTDTTRSGVKLPKIEVPSFDGDIMKWRQFWDQFCVSVHDRANLTNAERMVYLQQALKDGSAKGIIEGLAQSGEQYSEAIECLTSRFNRPRLIHQSHVKMIVEAPSVREGNGKELRKLHDTIQQHVRALRSISKEPSPAFITSLIELKLDTTTMFEWQRHTQSQNETPHYQEILQFLDQRAQASEVSTSSRKHESQLASRKPFNKSKPVHAYTANLDSSYGRHCLICEQEKHPLYACPKFKSHTHDKKLSVIKGNNLCMNCLSKGHIAQQCKSSYRCKKCQGHHHTLLHIPRDDKNEQLAPASVPETVQANTATTAEIKPNALLMTCRVRIISPSGSSMEARALLDSGSSASFVSERVAQLLRLNRSKQEVSVTGIGDQLSHELARSVTTFKISPITSHKGLIDITALVVSRVTCNLPTSTVPYNSSWTHIENLSLADPRFGIPDRIDLLLGVDIFTRVLSNGRRNGPPGAPTAIETSLGWVLCGNVSVNLPIPTVTANHCVIETEDDILRKFWQLEESPKSNLNLSADERMVVNHFKENHTRTINGRFVVPLPKKNNDGIVLGESRSQAVRRFFALERSLNSKGRFDDVNKVIQEYFELGHAEPVPQKNMDKPVDQVFYLPIHAVYKQSSSTTKIRAVFDASAKSTTGTSLNDLLLVGPTIHPPLIDVLLRFRMHRVALTADVSKMYRNIELSTNDRDLHRFVWRSKCSEPLSDYRMSRVTFGVSASPFAANMAVRQNAINLSSSYPLAAEVVKNSIYVDDCLTGADNIKDAISLYEQLQEMFRCGGFPLRKWNSSDPEVLKGIDPSLKETPESITLSESESYTKALGLEWNIKHDNFRLTVNEINKSDRLTKRILVSNIAKLYDVLGLFAPIVIKMKILLQRLWESKVDWDDYVPDAIVEVWTQWESELPQLLKCRIPRYYFSKESRVVTLQLHGFCDASENAYAGVVYLRGQDASGNTQVSLVIGKTRVAPLKRLTIPRLELCGAHLLSELIHHVKEIYEIPMQQIFAWTDSTIVLNWLDGSPRRFKTFVGNRVSATIDNVPSNRWNHVRGLENPADCASRGIFPSELLIHQLWWQGPIWLRSSPEEWPVQATLSPNDSKDEEREICLTTVTAPSLKYLPIMTKYSTFRKLQRVTGWIFRFTNNCRGIKISDPYLLRTELSRAESYWIIASQSECFNQEIKALWSNTPLPRKSMLINYNPFMDKDGMLRVGGRISNSNSSYNFIHPVILHHKHPVTKRLIEHEHIRLLHAGPSLVASSIGLRFRIIGGKKVIRSIVRSCVICRRQMGKTSFQMQGQLPRERIDPGSVFERVGVDYAGPLSIRYGYVRKPVIVKAYICLFVSLSVKAVHLEIVSDLTTEAFIAALRRFISRRGHPTLIWSDNGTNFVGADNQLKNLFQFMRTQATRKTIAEFCASQNIEWKFIPERSPHFGGLWEAAVKSMKFHLRRIVGDVKLTFEEMSTVICQIEACLNSRPLIPLSNADHDEVEVLTPGHFLIGHQLTALPDKASPESSITTLRRWHLCQTLIHQLWKRWSEEYVTQLNKYTRWSQMSRNAKIGDVVILRDETLFPTRWPLARIVDIHPGKDGLVRVVTLKTPKGTYKRPVTKIVILIPVERDYP